MEYSFQASILLNIFILTFAQNVQMPTYEDTIQHCALELTGILASIRSAISNVRFYKFILFWSDSKFFPVSMGGGTV